MQGAYGVNLLAGVLKGSTTQKIRSLGFNRLTTYGIMKERTLAEIKELINQLIAEDYLSVSGGQYPVVKLRPKALAVERRPSRLGKKRSGDGGNAGP